MTVRSKEIDEWTGAPCPSPTGYASSAPVEVVRQAPMGDHRPLRPAGRARRVDHVGQVIGAGALDGPGRRPSIASQVASSSSRTTRAACSGSRSGDRRRSSAGRRRPSRRSMNADPAGRVGRVDRHVGPARLEDRRAGRRPSPPTARRRGRRARPGRRRASGGGGPAGSTRSFEFAIGQRVGRRRSGRRRRGSALACGLEAAVGERPGGGLGAGSRSRRRAAGGARRRRASAGRRPGRRARRGRLRAGVR